MASIFYKYPTFYEIMIRLVHGKNLNRRYNFISKEIGRYSVLDAACGTSILKKFLPPECDYEGFDLNQNFINHSIKNGINVRKQSLFEFNKYPNKDILVLCDVLHHIYPKHKKFLRKIATFNNKKIIICESFDNNNNKNIIIRKIKHYLGVKIDDDGFNKKEDKKYSKWKWYSERELRNFFFEQIKQRRSLKIKKIGNDLIATYTLN